MTAALLPIRAYPALPNPSEQPPLLYNHLCATLYKKPSLCQLHFSAATPTPSTLVRPHTRFSPPFIASPSPRPSLRLSKTRREQTAMIGIPNPLALGPNWRFRDISTMRRSPLADIAHRCSEIPPFGSAMRAGAAICQLPMSPDSERHLVDGRVRLLPGNGGLRCRFMIDFALLSEFMFQL